MEASSMSGRFELNRGQRLSSRISEFGGAVERRADGVRAVAGRERLGFGGSLIYVELVLGLGWISTTVDHASSYGGLLFVTFFRFVTENPSWIKKFLAVGITMHTWG
jgi:hypothetical protein